MAPRLSAVILAAGFSSRMGELKATLPLGAGKGTVLERCLGLFRESGIKELLVVTGHRREEIDAVAGRAGARTVHNPDFASGMYSSIRTGVRCLEGSSRGFFLLPVDIPLVRSGTVRLLSGAFASAASLVTYPIFSGKRGHPPLIGGELISAIIDNQHPEGGLRSLLATVESRQPQRIAEVEVADANILFDMDTPEDYLTGRRRFTRLGYPTMPEAESILRLHPMPEKGLAHGQLVGKIAMTLCRTMARSTRQTLDPELCEVCGLLHDMAKGHPNHEREAARWLRDLGFDRAAEIVAAHKDLDWLAGAPVTEKELVHLADKLARGSRLVEITDRFEEKLALYRDKPDVVEAIHRRYDQARQLGAAVEAETGLRLRDILTDTLAGCSR